MHWQAASRQLQTMTRQRQYQCAKQVQSLISQSTMPWRAPGRSRGGCAEDSIEDVTYALASTLNSARNVASPACGNRRPPRIHTLYTCLLLVVTIFKLSSNLCARRHADLSFSLCGVSGVARLTLTNGRRANPLSLGLMRHATALLRKHVATPDSRARVLVRLYYTI